MVVELNGLEMTDRQRTHEYLAEQLQFPDYYTAPNNPISIFDQSFNDDWELDNNASAFEVIQRIIHEAKDSKMAIDATYGRRTRAVLIMDSGHIILSAVQPETVAGRVDKDISSTQVVSED